MENLISESGLDGKLKMELKSLSCHHGFMKITLSRGPRETERNTFDMEENGVVNITLSDTQCHFVVSKDNQNEMVLQTEYGKCGAVVHQTGIYNVHDNL